MLTALYIILYLVVGTGAAAGVIYFLYSEEDIEQSAVEPLTTVMWIVFWPLALPIALLVLLGRYVHRFAVNLRQEK
ncbi:hypothetical protein D3C78_885810 [compost metagenome]